MRSGSSRREARVSDPRALWRRSGLGRGALERLAEADALPLDRARPPPRAVGLEGARRAAAAAVRQDARTLAPHWREREAEGLLRRTPRIARLTRTLSARGRRGTSELRAMALLPEMPLGEHVVEDYASLGLTLKRHPLAFLRAELAARGPGHRRRTRPSAGRPAALDRRDRADPAAPGQRQRRRLHHDRGRDRDRQSDRLAGHARTLPPRRARRYPALLHRQTAARGKRHPCRRRPARRT